MWEQPPVIGYKVILNPEGKNYQYFKHQSGGGAGWIIGHDVSESELKEWSHIPERERMYVFVNVLWENNNKNLCKLYDLLPIENGFRDVDTVLFEDGYEVRHLKENIEEIIDYNVIVKGRRIVSHRRYGPKYRDKFLNQDNSVKD